jgi:hypothetical protein
MDEVKREKKRALKRAWDERNKERVAAYQKDWKAANKDHVAAYAKNYMTEYQAKSEVQFTNWVRALHRNYQLTPEGFNQLWDMQDGKCAICESLMQPRGRTKDAACVDHNHETNEIRGLLCRGCNHGIGNLKDSPRVLMNAAKYLESRGHYDSSDSKLKD